jgi:hypothetical protein
MSMIYLHNICLHSGFKVSLVMPVKLEAKLKFSTATMLFYIIYYHTSELW